MMMCWLQPMTKFRYSKSALWLYTMYRRDPRASLALCRASPLPNVEASPHERGAEAPQGERPKIGKQRGCSWQGDLEEADYGAPGGPPARGQGLGITSLGFLRRGFDLGPRNL